MPIEFTPASQRGGGLGQLPQGTTNVRRVARPLNGLEVGKLLQATVEELRQEAVDKGWEWPTNWLDKWTAETTRHALLQRPHLVWPAVSLLVNVDQVGRLWRLAAVVRLSDRVSLLLNCELTTPDEGEWMLERHIGSTDRPDDLRTKAGTPAVVEVTDQTGRTKRLELLKAVMEKSADIPPTQPPVVQVVETGAAPPPPPVVAPANLLPESDTPAATSPGQLPPRVTVPPRQSTLSTKKGR